MSNARDSLPSIRRAVPADAAGIAAVIGIIAAGLAPDRVPRKSPYLDRGLVQAAITE
ncbi:MAG: hypothetical protein HW394_1389 [Acidobacteria bacterium]|nr:hypothetical protein [Acidobacteriota bacterium]